MFFVLSLFLYLFINDKNCATSLVNHSYLSLSLTPTDFHRNNNKTNTCRTYTTSLLVTAENDPRDHLAATAKMQSTIIMKGACPVIMFPSILMFYFTGSFPIALVCLMLTLAYILYIKQLWKTCDLLDHFSSEMTIGHAPFSCYLYAFITHEIYTVP